MKRKLNILLTGASGAVGYEVLKQLAKKKAQFNVTAFDLKTQSSKRKLSKFRKDVQLVYGDLRKQEDVRKVTADVDVAIHLAAIIPPLADEHPELAHQVNVLGTEILVQQLAQQSPDAFLLYSSSIAIYGDRIETPFIKVGDRLAPSEGDAYALTKIKAEQIIRESKLNWSIFRLTAIMGAHKMSKLMFHMPLNSPMEICTTEDAGRAFVHAIGKKEFLTGKIFNLGGGRQCRTTFKKYIERSFKIMGLGECDFPAKAFAEKNFHCGYYEDGDDLEAILHFRRNSLETYFSKMKKSVPQWRKNFTSMFKREIKRRLLQQSEPLQAFEKGDTKMMEHYFKVPE